MDCLARLRIIYFTIYFVLAIKLDYLISRDLDDTIKVWEFVIMLLAWIASIPIKFINIAQGKQSNEVSARILFFIELFATIIFALI